MAEHQQSLTLSPCTEEHWEFVRVLRTDPRVLHGFIQQADITPEQQRKYMQVRWQEYCIALVNGQPAGFVGSVDGDIRVCTHPYYQGQGVGAFMVGELVRRFPRSFAKIKIGTRRASACLQRAGFAPSFVIYEKPPAKVRSCFSCIIQTVPLPTRPSAPRDQRTASTYIFGAVCPKDGKGAALILPACNTEAMNLHLVEIAKTVTPGAHAVLLVDQAGWHLSTRLVVPPNITIIALPPKCPELNLVENIWQFLHDNWLSNRVFKSYDDLVDHCLGSRFRDSLTMSSFRTIPCLFLHVEQQRILRLLGSGRIVR
jgi:hypothetical protein